MGESLLRLAEVKRRSGYSTSGLYSAMSRGDFPRPIKRGAVSLWLESEVTAAVERDVATLPRMGQSMGQKRREKKIAA